MKVKVLTCFESNEERATFVYDACRQRGYDVEVITTDFSHIKKIKRDNVPEEFTAIHANPYKINMGIGRILSHMKFARDAFNYIEEDIPDLIWLIAPANSLIKEAHNFKTNHPETKIIVDIIDMWPESLPMKVNKHAFPFSIWRKVRSEHINYMDSLVTECDLYQDILKEEFTKPMHTIYLARDNIQSLNILDLPDDRLSLCYIGSINNIIDTKRIEEIIVSLNRKVDLHVIGDGENKDAFLSELSRVANVLYYGSIYDEDKKTEIFNKCHAGINIYKPGLYIGLTTKCLDYFQNGLPIINNIKGDTWKMVENDKVGFNVGSHIDLKADNIIERRMDNDNVYALFNKNFSSEVFNKKCLEVIDEVMS